MSLLLTRPRNSWRSYDDKTSSGLCIPPENAQIVEPGSRLQLLTLRSWEAYCRGSFRRPPAFMRFRTRWSVNPPAATQAAHMSEVTRPRHRNAISQWSAGRTGSRSPRPTHHRLPLARQPCLHFRKSPSVVFISSSFSMTSCLPDKTQWANVRCFRADGLLVKSKP